ncbi:glycosyltransferase [Marinagarivorans algicola]|uniref:glycosyltransferase n=1 Tax=Marinagarivorans algicola TaxID=1513270 RepID=UPI0037352963
MFNQFLESTHALPDSSTILLVHYGDNWLRGSEHCLLNLCHALKKQGFSPIVWCNTQALSEALKSHGVPYHCSKMEILLGYQKKRYDLCAWYTQIKTGINLIKQYKPALVHINSAAPCQWMQVAGLLTNTPCITQLHAHYGTFKDRLTLGLHFCNIIMGVSHAAIRALDSDGTNLQQTRIILPNAIDALTLQQQPPVSIKKALGVEQDAILLLSVGSLIKRKGHRFLLDTLHTLNTLSSLAHHKPYYVAIIGDGEELESLKEQCVALNINKYVFFLGNQDNAFGYMLGDADALISTAIDEVFGLVLAEANLAKIPVIAPNIKGINSVIKQYKTGLLYTPNNHLSLQKALLSLSQHTDWQVRVSRGYYRALTTFNSHKHIYGIIQAYEQAIDIHQNNTFLTRFKKSLFVCQAIQKWILNRTLLARNTLHKKTAGAK